MSVRCCVEDCDNTNDRYPSKGTYYDGRFMRFPEQAERRRIWNEIIGSKTLVAKYICFEHFTEDDWRYQDVILNVPVAKRKLKPNAVPSRKLPIMKTKAIVKDAVNTNEEMDEQTRKRLVAEAMAEYEKLNSATSRRNTAAYTRRRHSPNIDEQTRKRLVAEALAAYESNLSDGNDTSSDFRPTTRKKRRTIKVKDPVPEVVKVKDEDEQADEYVVENPLMEYHMLDINCCEINRPDVKFTTVVEIGNEPMETQNIGIRKLNANEVPNEEPEIAVKDFCTTQTRKCGEVTLDIDANTFALNCSLCPEVHLNFVEFSNHILTQHRSLLENYYVNPLDVNGEERKNSIKRENEENSSCSAPGVITASAMIQETFMINELSSDGESQNSFKTNSDDEECFIASNDMIPNCHESNEINIDNQEVMKQIIDLLKQSQFHIIWDETHPFYTFYKKRKDAITELITILLQTFPKLPFTCDIMQALLTHLRQSYIRELGRRYQAKQNKEEFICNLWCFHELKFFGENFKVFRRLCQQSSIEHYEKIAKQQPLQPLFQSQTTDTEQKTMDIIEEYQNYPSLWNIKHPCYRGKFNDSDSLAQLHVIIGKKTKTVLNEPATLVQFLKYLNSWFSAEEILRQHSIQSKQEFRSNFPRIYAALEFLRGNVPPFKCKTCGNDFNVEYKYRQHLHRNKSCSRPTKTNAVFECQYCCKCFTTPMKRQQHMRVHTDDRPHGCQKCGKKFRFSKALVRHKRIHCPFVAANKTFKCDECEKLFHSGRLLRLHKAVHTKICDQVCGTCGEVFMYSHNLQRHQLVHRETQKPECNICGKVFKMLSNMLSHRQRCSTLAVSKVRKNRKNREATKRRNKTLSETKRTHFTDDTQTIVKVESVDAEDYDTADVGQKNLVKQEVLYISEDL